MGMIPSIAVLIFTIVILVTVHELGHLIAARMNGVFAEAFSVGFGRVLFKRKDKKGTEWRISLIPLGGYVKMFGDADSSSVKELIPHGYTEKDMEKMSLHRKKPWQKIIVSAAGPFANFVFAIVVLTTLSVFKGIPTYTNTINIVSENSLSYISGLRSGDKIIKAEGKDVSSFEEITKIVKSKAGKDLSFEVLRGEKTEQINIKMYDENNKPISLIGITPGELIYKKTSFFKSLYVSCITTKVIAVENIKGIFQMFAAKRSVKEVGGVISIFKMASDSAESGLPSFVWMLAFLSIILGAVNLLPIPVLDGGSIMISTIEWIIRKPLNKKLIEYIYIAGLVVVVGLMSIGLWNDIVKSKFFVFLENLFK